MGTPILLAFSLSQPSAAAADALVQLATVHSTPFHIHPQMLCTSGQ